MFTGIIEEVGRIKQLRKNPLTMELTIQCRKVLEGTQLGEQHRRQRGLFDGYTAGQ